jgi:YcxB-like protein
MNQTLSDQRSKRMINFNGQYTHQQLVAARVQGSGIRKPFRLMLWPITVVFGLALTTPIIMGGPDPANLTVLGLFLGVVVGAWAVSRYQTRRAGEATSFLELDGSADAEGLRLSSNRGSAYAPWSDFHKATVSRTTVLLFHSPQLATFIPREFFATDDDWAEFVRLVRAGVKEPPLVDWRAVFHLMVWTVVIACLLLAWAALRDGG